MCQPPCQNNRRLGTLRPARAGVNASDLHATAEAVFAAVTSVICHGTTMQQIVDARRNQAVQGGEAVTRRGFERLHTAPRGFFRAG